MNRAALTARRDAIRDMLRSGMRAHDIRHTLSVGPRTVVKLARTAEVRR